MSLENSRSNRENRSWFPWLAGRQRRLLRLLPCRWIVASELTITGSIGVIMHTYNYRLLFDKIGIRPLVIKSGRYKDMLSGEKNRMTRSSPRRKSRTATKR